MPFYVTTAPSRCNYAFAEPGAENGCRTFRFKDVREAQFFSDQETAKGKFATIPYLRNHEFGEDGDALMAKIHPVELWCVFIYRKTGVERRTFENSGLANVYGFRSFVASVYSNPSNPAVERWEVHQVYKDGWGNWHFPTNKNVVQEVTE